jgi:archaemetzincin
MGLGYRPGNACVASSFRLNTKNKNEQFYKIAIHELGHTQGLKHCPDKTCFMRDAEGKNPTNEEKDFCQNCKKVLRSKALENLKTKNITNFAFEFLLLNYGNIYRFFRNW